MVKTYLKENYTFNVHLVVSIDQAIDIYEMHFVDKELFYPYGFCKGSLKHKDNFYKTIIKSTCKKKFLVDTLEQCKSELDGIILCGSYWIASIDPNKKEFCTNAATNLAKLAIRYGVEYEDIVHKMNEKSKRVDKAQFAKWFKKTFENRKEENNDEEYFSF